MSLMATLREEGWLPIRSIQWYLQMQTVHRLKLGVGAIVGAIHRAAQQAQAVLGVDTDGSQGSLAPSIHHSGM